jgi:hypothetical protein
LSISGRLVRRIVEIDGKWPRFEIVFALPKMERALEFAE